MKQSRQSGSVRKGENMKEVEEDQQYVRSKEIEK